MSRRYKLLDWDARRALERLWNAANALDVNDIAQFLDVHPSSIYRELERGRAEGVTLRHFRPRYSAKKGQEVYNQALRRRVEGQKKRKELANVLSM
jgi:IS30 family transposase